jgi:hypothetical protein
MAISFNEFLSQASSGDYRHGLGKKKTCCESCTHGGGCTGCGAGAGVPCRCKGGGLGSTTIYGQADLEPGDWGYEYKQTTIPGLTVTGQARGRPPVPRRIQITQMVSELEFLAGTPGVHPRVLAQKVWQARKALMGSGRWSWANYQTAGSAYDSYDDLVSRLEEVESVLGVGDVSPKIMSQLYGMGGLGGLGGTYGSTGAYRGAPWGATGGDPITKLASCIRGLLCQPKGFCCPPGSQFEDPYYDDFPEFEEFPDFPSAGNGNGTWIGNGKKNGSWIGDPKPKTITKIGDDYPPYTQPPKTITKIGDDYPRSQPPKTGTSPKPKIAIGQTGTGTPKTVTRGPTTGGGFRIDTSKITVGGSGTASARPLVGATGGAGAAPGRLVGATGAVRTGGVTRGLVRGSGGGLPAGRAITMGAPLPTGSMSGLSGLGATRISRAAIMDRWREAVERARNSAPARRRSILRVARQELIRDLRAWRAAWARERGASLGGLGARQASPAIGRLIGQLRAASAQARRGW